MATRFEIVLEGDSPGLRALGEEALDEIERIEGLLSLYRATSEVSHLNARAGSEAVKVSPELFSLLERAVALSVETEGAFDVTIAPLVRCWGFMKGSGSPPTEEEIELARANVGFGFLELDRGPRAVRFGRAGMMLDFGAFGKGYAVDCAAEILREAGVTSALLHGGTSTVVGIGRQADGSGWKVAVEGSAECGVQSAESGKLETGAILSVVELKDESLGVSAVWGKSFSAGGRTFGHVLDGRTGRPVEGAELAAVCVGLAADSDALSTALLVDGVEAMERLAKGRPEARLLVLSAGQVSARRFTLLDRATSGS